MGFLLNRNENKLNLNKIDVKKVSANKVLTIKKNRLYVQWWNKCILIKLNNI